MLKYVLAGLICVVVSFDVAAENTSGWADVDRFCNSRGIFVNEKRMQEVNIAISRSHKNTFQKPVSRKIANNK